VRIQSCHVELYNLFCLITSQFHTYGVQERRFNRACLRIQDDRLPDVGRLVRNTVDGSSQPAHHSCIAPKEEGYVKEEVSPSITKLH
jgi:hypothetical protein